jgi:hypothetical protein
VSADTVDLLLAGLVRIADQVGVADPEGDSHTSARRLRQHLEARKETALLVIDNATDPDAIRPLLPASGHTQVIITSTDRAFQALGQVVDVDVYSREESVRYLHQRTGLDDPQGADDVAAALGDLPLGLAQAAGVVTGRRLNYVRYLERLRSDPLAQAVTRRAGEPYPQGAAEAILLAAAEDADGTDALSRVLETMAVLSAEGVPIDLLQLLTDQSDDDHTSLVLAAVETSVRFSVLAWVGTMDTVGMHRLIARVIRDRAAGAGRLSDLLDQAGPMIIAALVPEDQAWKCREQARHLPEQIAALWEAGQSAWSKVQPADGRTTAILRLRRWAVQHLLRTADLTRARAWARLRSATASGCWAPPPRHPDRPQQPRPCLPGIR